MEFKELEQLISQTAAQKGVDPAVLTADLADILKIKYGAQIMEKERELLDEVKTKIITKLYNTEEHKISEDLDLLKIFKLDRLETDYFDNAISELVQEGVVNKNKGVYILTNEGIMKFKEFYGEI